MKLHDGRAVQLLVVGAGPYGLATAACARARGIDLQIVGEPIGFWNRNMPEGMFLRSGSDWHLDAQEVHTFERYLEQRGLKPEQVRPISLSLFREYARWFMQQYDLTPRPARVCHLIRSESGFTAALEDGSTVQAENVLLGLGFEWFKQYPADLVERLPAKCYSHTCDTVQFDFLRGKRVLIIGGRQSAFEWAALMHEHEAAEIHLSYRHPTPEFVETDWSWVQPMVQKTVEDHSWWRRLPAAEQDAIRRRFWEAGRLKLEPWLAPRIEKEKIHLWAKSHLVTCERSPGGALSIRLSHGALLEVDHVLLATGYQVNMQNVPFLDRETVLERMQLVDSFPALDPEFQTSVPGLYLTGFAATRDFGPFFGFVVGAPVAARIVSDAIATAVFRE